MAIYPLFYCLVRFSTTKNWFSWNVQGCFIIQLSMFVVLIHFLFKTAYSLYLTTFYLSRTFLNSFFVFYIAVLATFDIIPCHCSNVNLFLFLISATLFILSSFQKKVNNFLLFFLKNFRNFIFYFPFLMFLTIKV